MKNSRSISDVCCPVYSVVNIESGAVRTSELVLCVGGLGDMILLKDYDLALEEV